MLHDRFGREQHESLIHQLFHIRQTSSVADYVERFSSLVDELASYESRTDPLYYTMRFIDGLRADIKQVIVVQRPSDLDTACALALVQEEATDSTRPRRNELSFHRIAPKRPRLIIQLMTVTSWTARRVSYQNPSLVICTHPMLINWHLSVATEELEAYVIVARRSGLVDTNVPLQYSCMLWRKFSNWSALIVNQTPRSPMNPS